MKQIQPPRNLGPSPLQPVLPLQLLPPSHLLSLRQHPNLVLQHLHNISTQQIPLIQKIRYLALSSYLHPVMTKDCQTFISKLIGKSDFWSICSSLTVSLEVVNIVALVPQMDPSILNINNLPELPRDSYEQALWVNVLITLARGQHKHETGSMISDVGQQSVIKVRDFINSLIALQKQIQKTIYQDQFIDLQVVGKHQSTHYHFLDIQLSKNNLLTINYLPEDYPSQFIQIWLDRTVQFGSLIGNFICKQRFGQFQYIRGPLRYALEQGITLVFNNFSQISSELLVSLVSLAKEGSITHNQITLKAAAGFKMVAVVSGERGTKSNVAIQKLVTHFQLPSKNILSLLPTITNETNRQLLTQLFKQNSKKLGYEGSNKLWKRIIRLRKKLINVDSQNLQQEQIIKKLWNSFFTQQFIQDITLELNDLTNQPDQNRSITYQQKYKQICIGRSQINLISPSNMKIVKTQYSLGVLEKLNLCFELGQCPLLISQTGCGKTTLVQYLSQLSDHKLFVYNMSSGTDVTDLIGGFRPIDCRLLLKQLFFTFLDKFRNEVPGAQKNEAYLTNLNNYYLQGKLEVLLKSLVQSIPKIIQQLGTSNTFEWKDMMRRFTNILHNLDRIDSNLVFSFLEGNLIKALRNGDWILIDEINLASNDVLQKIVPLIQGKSLMLYEKGDLSYIERHPDFRIVACMNPANDSGKKPLPPNLAQKFTSIVMSQPTKADIEMMTKQLCSQLNPSQIAQLYFDIKKIKTVSLRNLCRALAYINRNRQLYGWNRSVYDGLMLGFGQKGLLKKYYNDVVPKQLANMIQLSGFLLEQGGYQDKGTQIFHLTETFREHLKDLLRAIAGTELPVLLQGPTSAGKTSMIRYVASIAGHMCIRINNHEHTQIEQYIGNYFPDKSGKLVFREGPLVQAVRQGHWLILDQLNLAKTQILECLNRLLDDNRQLFIPEQQKHIKPHASFRIFATQNPSTYSGRKTLSRAFRNRFVSISFADINSQDTMAILEARSPLLKDSKDLSQLVKKTLESLTNYRQRQRVFEKDGLITIRNLLKWCERPFITKQKFILEGYAILAQKLRSQEQKKFVEKVLLTPSKLTPENVNSEYLSVVDTQFSEQRIEKTDIYVQMNQSFKRMSALTVKAVSNNQPVLLVGQTGCGKTTLAQLLAALTHRPFFSINCHKHMEASDLLGSLRPSSDPHSDLKFQFVNGVVIQAMLQGGILLIDEINTAEDSVLERLNQVLQCNMIGIERGQGWETVQAQPGFCIIATMNPSGDYGKKQLSPALRNRFTQIWVEPITHPQFIVQAKEDILRMIRHKLTLAPSQHEIVSTKIYDFLVEFNSSIAPKYNLTRKLLTMRDIGWICKFINECQLEGNWEEKYFWSIIILAIEGVRYIITDSIEGPKLEKMREQLLMYLQHQVTVKQEWIKNAQPQNILKLLKNMSFPLLIKTDVPLAVLGIHPDSQIFFSPQTDLSDLLGQYRPHGNQFIWHDQALLKRVKEGGVTALMDLNTAQQQVIEGVNSLFDHRGSLFVVELNQTFHKAQSFQGVVVLRKEGGNGRKGLANSFLNRFVKIYIPDVKSQVHMNYLAQKYPYLEGNTSLKSLIQTLLQQQKYVVVEQLEFIVQLASKGLLNQALQILNLTKYVQTENTSQYIQIESQLLNFFPLRTSDGINNSTLVKILISAYLTYRHSSFSLCLVGQSKVRQAIVKSLSYLLSRHTSSFLISTMLDLNDLLGTYEQISVNQEQMCPELSAVEQIFRKKVQKQFKSEQTTFAFVQSLLIKHLEQGENIIYVEVPNQTIAERIQKGLTDVYNHKKKIIMGTDLYRNNSIHKFITIHLPDTLLPSDSLAKTSEFFPSNQSKLVHLDPLIKLQQSENLVISMMNDENDRSAVTAWRRVTSRVIHNSQEMESRCKEQVRQKLLQQAYTKYKVKLVQNDQIQARIGTVNKHLELASSKEQFKKKITLSSFFMGDSTQLNKKLSMLGQEEQYLRQIITKFQVLFMCDLNNFRQNSVTLLPLVLNSKDLTLKYFKQIQRMYQQLFKFKVKQILVQFSEEQYKTVPILNCKQSIRYLMTHQCRQLRQICGQGVQPEAIMKGIQKAVIEAVKLMQIDTKVLSHWCSQAKIKHLEMIDMLQHSIKRKRHLLNNPLKNTSVQTFLNELNLQQSIEGKDVFQQGLSLWNIFKPHSQMSVNISYHLKNQLNLKYFKQLISNDQTYFQKYSLFSNIRYYGYQPSQLQVITQSLEEYHKQAAQIQKLLVYRGYDNIQSLIAFYQELQKLSTKIQNSNFDLTTIEAVVSQTYHTYYHIYSDILLPYFLALSALHFAKYQQEEARVPSIASLIERSKPNPLKLLEQLVEKQEGQTDRSKDYLKFQKKFKRQVIVDEYTQEGIARNKQNLDEQFFQLFGKQGNGPKVQSPFEQIYLLIAKPQDHYYKYLSQAIAKNSSTFEQLICSLHLQLKYPQTSMNIYEQFSPLLIKELVAPLPSILEQIHNLLSLYPMDNIKYLATVCSKIQQRSLYEQVYKILTDCQFLIEKIFQVNPILPMAHHIQTDKLIQNCLQVRKYQLKNWRRMLEFKQRRTHQSDMLQLLSLFKIIRQVTSQKQIFFLCEKYLRQSKLSCILHRISLLLFLEKQGVIKNQFQSSLFRVIGFFQYLIPDVQKQMGRIKKEKQKEMKEYQKLAGWNSNQYLIFKATCQKFQRKIHHILKRYDEQLSLTIGNFHVQLQNHQIFKSIPQFRTGLAKLIENKEQQFIEDNEEEQNEEGNQNEQVEQKDEKMMEEKEQVNMEQQQSKDDNKYQLMTKRVFQSLSQLKQEHHNTQSKLLIIRTYIAELEDNFEQFTLSTITEYKYITRSMFYNQEDYHKAMKYYYGLWDKLCQRAQTKWYREMTDRIWHLTQKIWVHINLSIKGGTIKYSDQTIQDLNILTHQFIKSQYKENYHDLFKLQLQKVQIVIEEKQKEGQMIEEDSLLSSETISLMKFGYIMANIALNIQKNGLCVKDQVEKQQQSGSQDIGQGMGVGQGQVHEAAQNVGDQIQFEEQIMGHKDEQKKENNNAGNKQDNDIEMENDFEGQMYSKEEQEEGKSEGQGKQQEAEQQMGQVDQKQKEKDMKNQAGQAEGKDEADVDIKNQQQGDEELVDNQREQKEQRRGQDKRQMNEQQEQNPSDWDDNNEEGQKINKQKENVQAHDRQDSSFEVDQRQKPEEMEEEGSVSSGNDQNQEQKSEEGSVSGSEEGDQQEEEIEGEGKEQGEQMQPQGENEKQEQDEKKPKKQAQPKRYGPAYGRRDLNTNNEVMNQEENQDEEEGDQGNEAQGQKQGNQGSGNAVHNLSAQFLQDVLKQQKAEGKQRFLKDLNVIMQDENQEAEEGGDQKAQQYELTEQKDKYATNIPLMDDQKMKNEEEQDRFKQKEQNKNREQNQRKEQQQQSQPKRDQKQKSSKDAKKNEQKQQTNQNSFSGQKRQNLKTQKPKSKQEQKYEKQNVVGDDQKQQLIKNALNKLKIQVKKDLIQEEKTEDILSDAYEVSKVLEEQLKSVLEPMDNAEYRGDFKTGKKLNLKKIIPFIASNFRKDRIWLRRTEPSDRNYFVMLALDDTKSMHYGNVGSQALKGLLAISLALEHLSIKTNICAIRDQMAPLKNFKETLNSQNIINNFHFSYESSNSHDLSMPSFMNSSLQTFKNIEAEDINSQIKKLCFIISDGKMNKKLVAPFSKSARKEDVTYIFIIVDSEASSILDIKTVEYVQKKMKIKNYMADFPFEYFLIINDVKDLGQILAMTLLQFIQEQ